MRVSDIMTREVIAVGPRTPVTEVARALVDHDISGVPVVEHGRLVGIITELDLLVRNANLHVPTYIRVLDVMIPLGNPRQWDEEIRRALGTVAEDVMTRHVITTTPDTDLGDAARVMLEKRVNPLPVVENGQVVGIISRSDFVRLLALDVPTE